MENYGGRGLVMQKPEVGLGYRTSHQWQDKDNNLNNSSCYDLLAFYRKLSANLAKIS